MKQMKANRERKAHREGRSLAGKPAPRAKKHIGWTRLDNAAKIFPPTSAKRDPKVFRFSCELCEPVDPALLQEALDRSLPYFRGFRCVLRHGFFWYYLEATDLSPKVHLEDAHVCQPLYDRNEAGLLFDISYYRCRINLEIYHALTDGTGALEFLKALVCAYLSLAHPSLPKAPIQGTSHSEQMADSFQKYYDTARPKGDRLEPAHRIHGPRLPEDRQKVIEGILPVDKVLALSKAHGGTLTAFLTALLICSFLDGMTLWERKRPVTVAVPVNLRNHFPSASVRNFFGVTYIRYRQGQGPVDFEAVIASVSRQLRENLTKERLQAHMNAMVSLEKNFLIRAVPLVLKDAILRIGNSRNDFTVSAALSNLGKVTVPPAYVPYIRLFDVLTSTNKIQTCLCSFQNNLVFTFTDPLVSADIQKYFFRSLARMGIPVTLVTSPLDEEATQHETL